MNLKPLVFAVSMLLAGSSWANGTNAATQPAPEVSPPPAAADAVDATPDALQKMNENLDRMRDLVGQMKGATDPAERQRLMVDYMTAQRENMLLARDYLGGGFGPGMGMMNRGMPGPGMGWQAMRGGQGPCMQPGCRYRDDDDDDHCMSPMHGHGMRGGMAGPGMGMHGMHGMHGGGMMGMQGGGMMGMQGGGMMGMQGGAMADRMDALEKRLDALQNMMQMMMNQ